MWEYKTEQFKVDLFRRDKNCDDFLNEYGKEGWEAFSIEREPKFGLPIGKYNHHIADIYIVKLKRRVE